MYVWLFFFNSLAKISINRKKILPALLIVHSFGFIWLTDLMWIIQYIDQAVNLPEIDVKVTLYGHTE